jgi:hypothetical protein
MSPRSGTRTHERERKHAQASVATILLALFTAACTGERSARPAEGGTEDRARAAAAPAEQPGQAAPDSASGVWTNAAVEVDRPDAGQATLSGLRAARHESWDRVGFEVAANDSLPGYRVALGSEPPAHCGSGEAVEGESERWLTVRLVPARAHEESGAPMPGGRTTPALSVIGRGELICDFEAHVEWTAPVPAGAEFRVSKLRSPARLVVDVRSAQ